MSGARTGDALLAQICATPQDDAPRHAYADWLIERGDPRGEYIALALDGRDEAARALLDDHDEWWEPFASRGMRLQFERGFPDLIVASDEQFLAARDELARVPATRLAISQIRPGHAAELAAAPELARYRDVEVMQRHPGRDLTPLGERDIETILRSPYLRPRRLAIGWSELGDAGHRVLVSLPWLGELEDLQLNNGPIATPTLRALLDRTRRLRSLDLAQSALAAEAVELLARAPWPRLRDLILTGNALGAAGARALASSPALDALTDLDVCWCQLGDAGIQAFVERTGLPALARLSIYARAWPSVELDSDAAVATAARFAQRWPQLEVTCY